MERNDDRKVEPRGSPGLFLSRPGAQSVPGSEVYQGDQDPRRCQALLQIPRPQTRNGETKAPEAVKPPLEYQGRRRKIRRSVYVCMHGTLYVRVIYLHIYL